MRWRLFNINLASIRRASICLGTDAARNKMSDGSSDAHVEEYSSWHLAVGFWVDTADSTVQPDTVTSDAAIGAVENGGNSSCH